jgi:hypothetical protein
MCSLVSHLFFICVNNFSAIRRLSSIPLTWLHNFTYAQHLCLLTVRVIYESHLLQHEISIFKIIYEGSVILISKCRALAIEYSLPTYFKVLGLTRSFWTGLKLTTYQLRAVPLSQRHRRNTVKNNDFQNSSAFKEVVSGK